MTISPVDSAKPYFCRRACGKSLSGCADARGWLPGRRLERIISAGVAVLEGRQPERAEPAPLVRSKDEAAKKLNISVRHLSDLLVQHRVPVLRLGRRVLLDEESFSAFEAACRSEPPSPELTERRAVRLVVPPRMGEPTADEVRSQIAANLSVKRRAKFAERTKQKLEWQQRRAEEKLREKEAAPGGVKAIRSCYRIVG